MIVSGQKVAKAHVVYPPPHDCRVEVTGENVEFLNFENSNIHCSKEICSWNIIYWIRSTVFFWGFLSFLFRLFFIRGILITGKYAKTFMAYNVKTISSFTPTIIVKRISRSNGCLTLKK